MNKNSVNKLEHNPNTIWGRGADQPCIEESTGHSHIWAAALLCSSMCRTSFSSPCWQWDTACGAVFTAWATTDCGSAGSLACTVCLDTLGSEESQEKAARLGEADAAQCGHLWWWCTLQAAGYPLGSRPETQLQRFQKDCAVWGVSWRAGTGDLHVRLYGYTKGCDVHTQPPGTFHPLLRGAVRSLFVMQGLAEDTQHLVGVSPWGLPCTVQRRAHHPPRTT